MPARFLLTTLVCFFASCTVRNANEHSEPSTYELVKDWPQLPGNFQMSAVSAVAIDNDQDVIFFQRTNRKWTEVMPDTLISANTLFRLDGQTGAIKQRWGANQFIMPHGLTVDRENNTWVTDVGLHQVFKFGPDGNLLMTLGVPRVPGSDSLHFDKPSDVAVAPDGSLFVTDGYGNSRVIKLSKEGKYLFEWGKKGTGPGEFDIPHSVSLDSEVNVYVADRDNNRIQKFDPDGKFLLDWCNNEANKLYALSVSNDKVFAVDDLYVNDSLPFGDDIIGFDTDFKLKLRFGRNDSIFQQSVVFHDIAVDKDENIYGADIFQKRVLKFRKVPGR